MRLFGFSLIRNGLKYDYSFQESYQSLAPIVEKTVIAAGDSEDETDEALKAIPKVEWFKTSWDKQYMTEGLILSQQTNLALDQLRKEYGGQESTWGFYLQGDEVLHEEDYDLIRKDITLADKKGYDAVRFRYLHFWKSHSAVAINKKWYPQEIRAVKLNSKVESWGDAQSFRNSKLIFESDATIYHYGHVRKKSSYQEKKHDFLYLYHNEDRIRKYRRRENRFDSKTEILTYLGTHPEVMKKRILDLGDPWEGPKAAAIQIIGDGLDPSFLKLIHADEVFYDQRPVKRSLPSKYKFYTHPAWWRWNRRVPKMMRSKLARPWSLETRMIFQLSAQGVGLKKL